MTKPTDAELVAVYDAAWNELDDGSMRVAVLEVAAMRAVYEAGRSVAAADALDGLVWGLTGAWPGLGGPSLGEVVRYIRERAEEYRAGHDGFDHCPSCQAAYQSKGA